MELFFLALLIVLMALYLVIGRVVIYTYVSDKERLEALFVENGFGHVAVGTVTGDWSKFDPVLELSEVRISTESESGIAAESVRLKVNSIASFYEQGIIVSDVEVRGLVFSVLIEDGVLGGRRFRIGRTRGADDRPAASNGRCNLLRRRGRRRGRMSW